MAMTNQERAGKALNWFEQNGFAEGRYGVAEQLSKSNNTSVAGRVAAHIARSKAGKVRLLKSGDLRADWNPGADSHPRIWEMLHQRIRALESGGEPAAAALVAKLGSPSVAARERCYRLSTAGERKKRAQEALSSNALVQRWPEIARFGYEGGQPKTGQGALFGQGSA